MWKVANTLFVKNVSKKLCTFVCCGLILFSFFSEYGNFSSESGPWDKRGFCPFRPQFGLRIRGEGGSTPPPPGPLALICHCIWLDCTRGLYAVSVDYLIACGIILYNQSNFDCKLLLISGLQIKPPRSHHCSICKRWIYCIISFSSFNFFTNGWILMLRAFIVTYSV